jgi:hypothetical protein
MPNRSQFAARMARYRKSYKVKTGTRANSNSLTNPKVIIQIQSKKLFYLLLIFFTFYCLLFKVLKGGKVKEQRKIAS